MFSVMFGNGQGPIGSKRRALPRSFASTTDTKGAHASLLAERGQRISPRGGAGGDVAGRAGHEDQHRADGDEWRWVDRVDLVEHGGYKARDAGRAQCADDDAGTHGSHA